MHEPQQAVASKAASKEQVADPAQRAASVAALGAGLLALSKLLLFLSTGSMIVGLSAWDSSIDVCVSLINRRIVRFARQSADDDHPYGHGKAESIAALGQGALIFGGALLIFASSARRLFLFFTGHSVEKLDTSWFAVVFFAGAAGLSLAITLWLRHHGRLLRSPALLADSEHYRTDVLTNVGSGLAMGLLIVTQREWLDPVVAGALAGYIGWSGFGLMRDSVQELMDRDVPENIKTRALTLIWKTDARIIDVHNFRGRKSGHRFFFDFHVTLPTALNFADVHAIVDSIEDALMAEFDADVVVHADPACIRQNKGVHAAPGAHRPQTE